MNRAGPKDESERRINGDPNLQVLITAAEAFPHLERLFLEARSEIQGGFRIFDPETRLRSDAARSHGDTWYDLIVATLKRGVRIRLVLSDFDPIHGTDLHRTARRSLHQLRRAGVEAGASERLLVRAAPHPSQTGCPLRVLLARAEKAKLRERIEWLNGCAPKERSKWLKETPGVTQMLTRAADRIGLRPWRLPRMLPGTHHQKMAVFDRERLYIGGLDLDERRYDDPGHRRAGPKTWHDVQLSLRGPIAAVAAGHLEDFQAECAGLRDPTPRPGLLRTLSVARHPLNLRLGPRPTVHEIRDWYLREVARAERFIYIETQFLRDPGIARALARRGRETPNLSLIAVLPAAPEDVAFDSNKGMDARFGEYLQARAVTMIQDAMGDRAVFVAPAQPERDEDAPDDPNLDGAPLVYVHAKVCVIDDRRALVGSANLNGRSLLWDTETAVELEGHETAGELRRRLMGHWLEDAGTPAHFHPDSAARAWADTADANAARRPEDRDCFVLPYPLERARAFGRWLPEFLHPMV